jgi:hypothetical protein
MYLAFARSGLTVPVVFPDERVRFVVYKKLKLAARLCDLVEQFGMHVLYLCVDVLPPSLLTRVSTGNFDILKFAALSSSLRVDLEGSNFWTPVPNIYWLLEQFKRSLRV